jgi:hypothetical protein
MKKISRFSFALLLLFAFSGLSYGWNESGHMAVAYVTYMRLNDATRKRVDKLIQLNPRYSIWVSRIPPGASDSTKKRMLFMIAATWADEIKGDGEHFADGPEKGNIPPSDGTADNNIGYSDRAMHKYWHFVDLPFSTDGTPTSDPEKPNARTQIEAFRKVLQSSDATPELKSYDLVWLLHLVGDVHQPLHCSARFSQQSPKGDAGGNFVQVCNPQCGLSLHSFWDGLLGPDSNPEIVTKIAQGLPAPNPFLAPKTNAVVWIDESFSIAKSSVYRSPIGPGSGPFSITTAYRANATRIARERISLAGARLARILNAELK